MPKGEALPEHLRCNRTDGRKWRCNRPVMENKKLCEIHHLQGRHRQHKEKVPEYLKIERKPNKSLNQEIRVNMEEKEKVKKRKRSIGGDLFDGSLKEIKMKKSDLNLDLIREFLKKQVEEKKEKKIQENEMQKYDLLKDLANGVMAITSSQSGEKLSNAGVYNVKTGLNSCSLEDQKVPFCSKDVEPIHTSAVEALHSLREAMELRRVKGKRCHWCRRSSYHTLIECASCHKQFFCEDCIKARCISKLEIERACPICLGTCSCRACSTYHSKDVKEKDYKENNSDDAKLLLYLVHVLLPVIEKVNLEQKIELDIESRTRGKRLSELHIPQIKYGYLKLTSCNNCKASVVDLHRSCTRCLYNLCLSCCREFRQAQSSGGIRDNDLTYPKGSEDGSSYDELPSKRRKYNTSRQGSCQKPFASPKIWQNLDVCKDKIISCPDNHFGGCGESNLDLRSVFSFGWLEELQVTAEEVIGRYDLPETPDFGAHCNLCRKIDHRVNRIRLLQETARRNDPSDNFLYNPTVQNLHIENLEHFQKHWGKGHPVILRNLIKSTSKLSWDPFSMFCSFVGHKNSDHLNDTETIKSKNCLDWCEVEICNTKTYMGAFSGHPNANVSQEVVKLQGWLSHLLFQKYFPAHYADIMEALPLKEYISPECSILNLALKLPNEMPTPDLGPCMYITYGGPVELAQANFLTRLSYDAYDVVNILAHATDVPISTEELGRLKGLLKKHKDQDYGTSTADATRHPLENQIEVTSMMNREDAKVTRRLSLYSEDTEESVSQDVTKEELNIPDEVLMHSTDSDRGCAQSLIDLNIPIASEQDPEYDSEATVSATIQGYEDSENESSFMDGVESSIYDYNKSASASCGAQWDIFRRQDVPKLLKYLRRYSKELTQSHGSSKQQVVHPILDQSFFLDAFHIMRLKEEFNIEPWTFKQNIGEAVMIPAGCPYQVKKVKSCVNVVWEFISPESAHECIELVKEMRLLPQDHKAKNKIPEVEKMSIYGINAAIAEIKQSYTSRLPKV